MALVRCKGCGNPVDGFAKVCPKCGRAHPQMSKPLRVVLILTIMLCSGIMVRSCCVSVANKTREVASTRNEELRSAAEAATNRLAQKVAEDAVREYNIVGRHGSKIDICVHAGVVASAYLQAKDEEQYRNWKAIEKKDCAKTGIRQ